MANVYRCIHCGGVTGSAENSLDAMEQAMNNHDHGYGVCVPHPAGTSIYHMNTLALLQIIDPTWAGYEPDKTELHALVRTILAARNGE